MFVYVYYLKVSLLNFHNSLVMFVYSIDDPKKTDRLLGLDGAKERLKLFKANLLEEGSFDSVVDECVGVFHTASPVFLAASDPQVHLIAFFFSLKQTQSVNMLFQFCCKYGDIHILASFCPVGAPCCLNQFRTT